MIENKLQFYETYAGYIANAEHIPYDAIVFVKDVKSIITHGTVFTSAPEGLGSSTDKTVSQQAITDEINRIWQHIGDIEGVDYGINMTVDRSYFIGEDGCIITINANTVGITGIFEEISFYWNNEDTPFYSEQNVPGIDNHQVEIPLDKLIDDKIIIVCKAKVSGIDYTMSRIIAHYDSFWIGGGSTYTDVMDLDHVQSIEHHMRGSYDVEITNTRSKLIIVIGASFRDAFIRADLNGTEIDFTENKLDANGNIIPDNDTTTQVEYIGLMSEPWVADTYNIDING